MKPASETVILNAINLVVQDVAAQNPGYRTTSSKLQSTPDVEIGLRELDSHIKAMSNTFRIVKSHFQSHISQMKRHRNTLSLIHRLPIEILVEIFRHVTKDGFYTSRRYLRLGDLSRVCALWGRVIEQSPTLWTTIWTNDDTRLIKKIISRSGNHPLSIYANQYEGWGVIESCLQQLSPQLHRWKIAEFRLQSQDIKYLQERLADASAPKLEKLCVSVYPTGVSASTRVELFRGGVECLKELELSGVSMPWTSPLLSRLRVLRLASLGESAAVTTAHILTALAQCPEISELRIYSCDLRDSHAPDFPTRLELPHLHVLSLDCITPSAASYSILRGISSPKYDQFTLTSAVPSPPDNLLSETISHIIPSLVHLPTSARRVTIRLGDRYCQYETENGLKFRVVHPSPPTVLGWMTTAFGDAMRSVQTELHIGFNFPPSENDLLVIGGIPMLTLLNISGLKDQTPIIRFLSTTTLVNGKQRWPFPKLASLSIEEDVNHPSEILRMVESRYGHNIKSKKAKSKARLPTPFTSFIIHGSGTRLGDRTFHQIREIVGEDHFTWDIQEY
ncbi:hypothetical protein FRB99_002958 [Tulasnella sp. 403]|nr:hypothetical protein FRB99_002958 [Tulasnella sp. 403]